MPQFNLSVVRMWEQHVSGLQWHTQVPHAASLQRLGMPPRVSRSQDVAELAACCESALQQQRHIKETLRRINRREQKARARSRASWQNMISFGVVVLAIVGAEFSWVPNLLSRFQQTADPEQVQDEITKKYLELSTEEIAQLLAPADGQTGKHQLNQAHAFAAQFSIWSWVDLQNRKAGVAPTVADVIEQRNLQLDKRKSSIWGEYPTASSMEKSASYKWVARWKRDWNLAVGKASEHEVLPTETVRTKALAECSLAQNGRRHVTPFSNACPLPISWRPQVGTPTPSRDATPPEWFCCPDDVPRRHFHNPEHLFVASKKRHVVVKNGPKNGPKLWAPNRARLTSWYIKRRHFLGSKTRPCFSFFSRGAASLVPF